MKIICVIQARMGSTRYPGKIMAPILGYPMLYRVIQRVAQSKVKHIVVATTTNSEDDITSCMKDCYHMSNVSLIRGSADDVLSRYIQAADLYKADAVIRITADCPLIDSRFIDEAINIYRSNLEIDYIGFNEKLYLEGACDVELVKTSTLKEIAEKTVDYKHREHVVTYILENPSKFKILIRKPKQVHFVSNYHLSVDTIEELNNVRKIYTYFSPRVDFTHDEIVAYLKK